MSPHVKSSGLEVRVSAPGKVILHGEHSVVYGKLALAASLGLRTNLRLEEINTPNAFVLHIPNLDFIYTFDLQKLKFHLMQPPLPITQATDMFNWEHPDLVYHDTLVDRVEDFVNNNAGKEMLNVSQTMALKVIFYLFSGILGSVNVDFESLLLHISSDLSTGSGIGSSASYSVSVSAGIIQYIKLKKSGNFSKTGYKPSDWPIKSTKFNKKELEMICNWAFYAEKIIHGTPSGIDNTICTYGSMVEFRKGLSPKLLPIKCPFKVILVNTNVPRQTKHLVAKVGELRRKYPDLVNTILNAMEDVAVTALQYITKISELQEQQPSDLLTELQKYYQELATLSSINQNLLGALGVSHVKLDEVLLILAKHGFKGKLTGAGGGGYVVCLVPPMLEEGVVENVMSALTRKGFGVVCTLLGGVGVTVD